LPHSRLSDLGIIVIRPDVTQACDLQCPLAAGRVKASQWLKVLIVNTRLPVVVCGMPAQLTCAHFVQSVYAPGQVVPNLQRRLDGAAKRDRSNFGRMLA
jgi:hypothetical protein